jgi:hypothetical protein
MATESEQTGAGTGAGTSAAPSVRPAVYWFWSEIPTPAQAERQLCEIAGAGFGAVMIQARLGFDRERYLSAQYLCGYRAAVEAAAAAGLEVWIYDDYNWISGHAGGRTVQGAGHLRERHLFWTTSAPDRPSAPATISAIRSDWIDSLGAAGAHWIYEDGVRAWDEWEIVAAAAHPPHPHELIQTLDLTEAATCDGGPHACAVSLSTSATVPDGWVVTFFVSARCATSRLINYLDPGAAQRFLEVSYRPYLQALDGLVGDPVRGFSFDHPYGGFYDWAEREGAVTTSLMWHRDARLADGEPGLSAAQLLLAVVRDLGPPAIGPRCRFFEAYAARGIESFFGTLAAWTREHGVGLTGHELLAHVGGWDLYGAFSELDIRTNFGGDYFAIDAARTETLVDASNFEAQLSPVMGDSVARAHGRRRCTVEQYAARREPPEDFAAGYWELSLPELRLQTMRLHMLGARRLLFHAFGQSDGSGNDHELLRNPRFDFPPTCNFEPWFDHLPALAQESAAVSGFIEDGEPIHDVALVHPLHTLWAHGQTHPHGRCFGEWAQLLSRAGVGFDVVDDRDLERAQVRDGRLTISGRSYGAVVLAGVGVLPSLRSADVLDALCAAGGTVVATDPLPTATARAGAVAGLRARIAAVCVRTGSSVPAQLPSELLAGCTEPGVDPGDGEGTLWRTFGRDARGTRVALLNDGPDRRRVTVTSAGPVRPRRLRGDGELVDWPWNSGLGGEVVVDLEPGEVACLHLGPADGPRPGLVECSGFVGELSLGAAELAISGERLDRLVVRTHDGTLVTHEPAAPKHAPTVLLDSGWTLSVDGATPVAIDPRRGWEHQGHATFAGHAAYRCRFDWATAAAATGDEIALTLPVVHCAAGATLNGVSLGERGWAPYRFDIPAGLLRGRDNELELSVANSAANRYYAGTPFQHGLQPSGLGGVPLVHATRRRYRVSLEDADRPAR